MSSSRPMTGPAMQLLPLLKAYGPDIWDARIKMVRHSSSTYDLPMLVRTGMFVPYERHQASEIYRGIDYVLTFMGEDRSTARFVRCLRVSGIRSDRLLYPENFPYPEMPVGSYTYDLDPVPGFEALEDRVVIHWPGGRAWHQHFTERNLANKPVIEVRPVGYAADFPGYDNVLLSFQEMKRIIDFPDANRGWHMALSEVAGIYLILDTTTGRQYIGSASGPAGILGRWRSYAKSGHGDNRDLEALLEDIPSREHALTFSILRTLPASMTQREVHKIEALYKRKLGTRGEGGLNAN